MMELPQFPSDSKIRRLLFGHGDVLLGTFAACAANQVTIQVDQCLVGNRCPREVVARTGCVGAHLGQMKTDAVMPIAQPGTPTLFRLSGLSVAMALSLPHPPSEAQRTRWRALAAIARHSEDAREQRLCSLLESDRAEEVDLAFEALQSWADRDASWQRAWVSPKVAGCLLPFLEQPKQEGQVFFLLVGDHPLDRRDRQGLREILHPHRRKLAEIAARRVSIPGAEDFLRQTQRVTGGARDGDWQGWVEEVSEAIQLPFPRAGDERGTVGTFIAADPVEGASELALERTPLGLATRYPLELPRERGDMPFRQVPVYICVAPDGSVVSAAVFHATTRLGQRVARYLGRQRFVMRNPEARVLCGRTRVTTGVDAEVP
jgi:hypothetical protein